MSILPGMTRKTHTKSRLGCQVCKQRKVKCDERKPACDRCTTAGRRCSYLGNILDLPIPASSLSIRSHKRDNLSTTPQLTPDDHDGTSFSHHSYELPHFSTDPSLTDTRFSLVHFELLDHLRNDMTTLEPVMHHFIQQGYKEALRVPYLMEQLLALAAAHKSTVTHNDDVEGKAQHFYRTESTRLQNRALSHVTLGRDAVNDDNADALYIFSTLLGHHVLFETFTSTDTLAATLDRLVQCFELHQSIRVTAAEAFRRNPSALIGIERATESYMTVSPQENANGTECARLLGQLRASETDQAAVDVYCETVNILQYLFDSSQFPSHDRSVVVVQEWLVRVPYKYLACLRQRRPEALVVLAHYAVLLHRARHYWAVAEAGRFLIESIGSHLGEYWTDWLAWPQQALGNIIQ